jgi:hypothetical protein
VASGSVKPPSRGSSNPEPPITVAYFRAFQNALRDPDRGVRALAAAALSNAGEGSPPVKAALKDAIEGKTTEAPGAFTPVQIARVAAKAKNNPLSGSGRLTPRDVGSLIDLAARERDPAERKSLLAQAAEGYMNSPDPERARDDVRQALSRNPDREDEILDAINRVDCKPAPKTASASESAAQKDE